jgi:TamB, inner membrane protein subunit of TAM complex
MRLNGVLLKDLKGDTLVSAGQIGVNITDWFFFKDKIELKYIGLKDTYVHLFRTDSVWNYQFLSDYFGSGDTSEKKTIQLFIRDFDVSNLHLIKQDAWRGEDMDLNLDALSLDAEQLDLNRKTAIIHLLKISKPDFAIRNYIGNRPTQVPDGLAIVNDPLHLRWNPAEWNIVVRHAIIENGSFRDDKILDKTVSTVFDSYHMRFSEIQGDFKDFSFVKDTILGKMRLSTKEKSGLIVRSLNSNIKFYPEGMEFNHFDLVTSKSHIRDFFAMRFKSFDDLSEFTTKVKMEADFSNATIDSDDIGCFSSDLKTWKKNILISGKITGSVSDFAGKNIRINAGLHTELKGDIHLAGLPDINKTFIDFRSNDFRTTYQDIITFIPSLKKISNPRIDRIQNLRFVGNFQGTVQNFVTSGTIETNLGTLVTNVTMQIPTDRPATYSGNLLTNDFQLGRFLEDSSLGKISFKGKVHGSGLALNTINASLDGNVREFSYQGYTYEDIFVNGQVMKKRFDGKIISNDSNLHATLIGLIDFSKDVPKFDFNAVIDNANLRALHFTRDSIGFNGKLAFNFTGNDIDHFLGKARIFDASIYKRGQRLSFDSLVVESNIIDSSKTITVMSNEFEAAIVGEFSIKKLPASFQEFLHRYYPSYIKPNTVKLSKEKFSFVITTRQVDPYLDLFTKNFRGFNNTNINGRINSDQNLLNINADVPQFNYKNISFYKVELKGNGNYDSLSVDNKIGEVYVNDSLHFPLTHIQLRSFNDISDVKINTSANQTLNAANISAQVTTLTDGVKIKFNPSTFDINSKTWTIDKNGELLFSKNTVGAESVRIYSGEQQFLVSTTPSGEGNWNDVHMELQKINIGDFAPFFIKDERVEGVLTGKVDVIDPFNHTYARFKGMAEYFRFSNDSVGKINLTADYNKQTGIVNGTVNSENQDYHFDLKGIFNTSDSALQPINVMIPNMVNTKIDLLEKYIGAVFSNVTGYATGNLQIVGTGDKLDYIGDIHLTDARLHVNYTRCTYRIPSAMVHMRADGIDFGAFQIKDSLGNTAEVSKGKLFHHSFRNLSYDFAINTNKLLLLNTHITDNNQFYGTMIGRANVKLYGPQEDLQMEIKGEPTDSSYIFIPTNTSRESAEADFIVWKVYGKEMKTEKLISSENNFTVSLDITANNYANVSLIIDPLTKDIIRATGHGNLQMRVGTNEDMSIRGLYVIDRGNYNFSFQSFIKKPFVFSQGRENFIRWSGDPYDADINIQAIYEAENIQFSALGFDQTKQNTGGSQGSSGTKNYLGPVWVVATLKDKLMHPTISFELQLPPKSELRNDITAQGYLDQINSDPGELNKQVAFLLVFNSFGPVSNSTSAFTANQAVGGIFVSSISSYISGAMSSYFSSKFQQVFKDKSLRVNFNTAVYNGYAVAADQSGSGSGSQSTYSYDRTNLNLSVIKSFMNERLTFTVGSAFDFGLTAQQASYAAVQFLPNLTAEYKLTENGRVVLTFFYRDSYNYLNIGNHTMNSSGTSISYRRDFDRLDEVFKKKKKTDAPASDSTSTKN